MRSRSVCVELLSAIGVVLIGSGCVSLLVVVISLALVSAAVVSNGLFTAVVSSSLVNVVVWSEDLDSSVFDLVDGEVILGSTIPLVIEYCDLISAIQ